MSTTLPAHLTMDVSASSPVPMSRLTSVELRKIVDTRAGRWFAVAILALLVVVEVIYSFAAKDGMRDFDDYLPIAGGLLGYFLPILIIMSVTSEASQRNGLITFTLEPKRSRVVVAKLLAGIVLALAMLVVAFVLALLGTAFGLLVHGGPVDWSVSGHLIINAYVVSQLIGVFIGFAIAMLVMNTAGGIVGYFAYTFILPVALGILGALSSGFNDALPWIDFNTAQSPLIGGDYSPTGQEWLQILVTGLIWLVLPLAIGIRRLLRIEFK